MRASDDLVCCPVCDALHEVHEVPDGVRMRCVRCGTTIAAGRPGAITLVVVLAITSLVLMSIVVFYPFLQLRNGVFSSRTSVFETAMSFNEGIMAPLALAVTAFVIVLPVLRLMALIWSLGPLAVGLHPLPGASLMLRFSETVRPWAMAEIFMLGVAVALVKLADLATLTTGPAFWSFGAIVLITALQDNQMSKHSIWTALETAQRT